MSRLSWIRGVNGTLGRLVPERVASTMRQAFMTRATCRPRPGSCRCWPVPSG